MKHTSIFTNILPEIYTKLARPSVIYFGLLLAAVNTTILPTVVFFMFNGERSIVLPVPEWFYVAWGTVATTYVFKRTAEKLEGKTNATGTD